MDKRAWIHQLKKQLEAKGEDGAPWYVSWNDPNGKQCRKSCGPGKVGKSAANKLADKIHSELVTGTYLANERVTWDQFFAKYAPHIESRYGAPSRKAALLSIRTFVRIANPKRMQTIDTAKIDEFIGKRRKESAIRNPDGKTSKPRSVNQRPGKRPAKPASDPKPPRTVSLATINRELRYIKAALRLAVDWGFMEKIPRIRFLKPPEKLTTFVSPEHFAAIFTACEVATMPGDLPNVSPVEWWSGLLVLLYMTGWRIGQTLKIRLADVDFEAGTVLSRADANKGGRDELIPLHPIVLDRLRPLAASFNPMLFPWNHHNRTLWEEFRRIQEAAKLPGNVPMPKAGKNGGWYGFHDLRRGFATCNALSMNLFELQALMQHKSLETTRGYVNMATKLNKAVGNLFVPTIPHAKRG